MKWSYESNKHIIYSRYPLTGWTYSEGFINDEMIAAHLLPANDDTIVLLCGPPPMINFACNPALDKLGFHPDTRFAY